MSHSLSHGQGLYFVSHEEVQNKRTGIELFPMRPLSLNTILKMDFDLRYRAGQDAYYGYIFRVVLNEKLNVDLVSRDYGVQHKKLSLVVGDREYPINLPNNEKTNYTWLRASLSLDLTRRHITFQLGGELVNVPLTIPSHTQANIAFGATTIAGYSTTDVPPIYIRDIKITVDDDEYNWLLDNEDTTEPIDIIQKKKALVMNPVWVEALHRKWVPLVSLHSSSAASICFDEVEEVLYVIGDEYLIKYHIASGKVSKIDYSDGRLGMLQGNQSIYVSRDRKLYNYFPDQQLLTSFDWKTKKWSAKYKPGATTAYWHANKFYWPQDSALYTLGGYGYFTYKNQIAKTNLSSGASRTIDLQANTSYTPRYLAAVGQTTDKVYILGGYGNESGKQELNPHFYYDLLAYTPQNNSIRKIADLPLAGREMVFGNSLVVDSAKESFYALMHQKNVFETHIKLIRGRLDGSEVDILNDSIPYRFSDIKSYSDLYLAKENQKLVAVTLFDSGAQTEIKVYGISFRPHFIVTNPPVEIQSRPTKLMLVVVAVIFLAGLVWWLCTRKKGSSKKGEVAVVPMTITANHNLFPPDRPITNAIFLFGSFRVFNRHGVDITKQFTPVLRQLFISICLSTFSSRKGIGSERLYEWLWSDKSTKSARNNLLVNMGKLKSILSDLDGLELSKETGYWSLIYDCQFCSIDYSNLMSIQQHTSKDTYSYISHIADIVQHGGFLEGMNLEWMDEYKSAVSSLVSEAYVHYLNAIDLETAKEDIELTLASKIAKFSSMNEEAMTVRCIMMSRLGMHNEAKMTYESFTQEYHKLYDELYPISLPKILKKDKGNSF